MGRNFAIIVDDAHSTQTGTVAMKLKSALADTKDALREYAKLESKVEAEVARNDAILREMLTHGKHKNLSFFAFACQFFNKIYYKSELFIYLAKCLKNRNFCIFHKFPAGE